MTVHQFERRDVDCRTGGHFTTAFMTFSSSCVRLERKDTLTAARREAFTVLLRDDGFKMARPAQDDDLLAARSRSTRSVTSRAIATAPSTSLSVSPLTIAKVISTYSLRPLL